ncbi:cysteine-rich venom protein 6-like [Bufo gargarizans]|uniref:cysteine-rich venom protein 6-like n=1 Tax=Bufo gargarizans TaxID=30331 RepID=UPI001CF13D58|nr:cysteine-rich venom protein 6-like [Bufo gargarizans]
MTRTITLLLISLSVLLALVTTESEIICAEDKERDYCGSPCPPTCDNPRPNCMKKCAIGCFCKKGTIDNGLGECVETDKCKSCSGNTTFTSCINPCPKLNNHFKCLIPCREGCICKSTYEHLPGSNICVLPQDLPQSGSNK